MKIEVSVTRHSEYPIYMQRGIMSRIASWIPPHLIGTGVVFVTDTIVANLYGPTIMASLDYDGIRGGLISMSANESAKNIDTFVTLLDRLNDLNVERRTLIVAVGGGVVCDTVGFVASAYMRGIPYVNVPTTLVAQVDAGIGGKVGVNMPFAKNFVGTFYHPSAILIDPDVLTTLPARELSAGFAEVIKVAIIASERLFQLIEDKASSLREYDAPLLDQVVSQAARLKVELLVNDPFEFELQRELNLGHTLAHPIEAASHYSRYIHGEAVSIGLAISAQIAYARGMCSATVRDRIVRTLHAFGLPTGLDDSLWSSVLRYVDVVRRIRDGHIYYVLPVEIGRVVTVDDVENIEIEQAIHDVSAGQ